MTLWVIGVILRYSYPNYETVAPTLGLSTGFASKHVDGKKVYFDSVKHVRKKGLCLKKAVEEI